MSTITRIITPREGIPIPPITIDKDKTIQFCHPGYEGPASILFSLSMVDTINGTKQKCVQHATALTACKIIANNAVNGYLASDREGRNQVPLEDDVLTEWEYWFFTGNQDDQPYPIAPSFRDWEFPHNSLIADWPEATASEGNIPDTCLSRYVVSRGSTFNYEAQAIPQSEQKWYDDNGLRIYGNINRPDIDKPENTVTLRHDIHDVYDSDWFGFVPRLDGIYRVYVLSLAPPRREFAETYHNVPVSLRGVASEYLFARPARSVLLLVKGFLLDGKRRRVVRCGPTKSGKTEWLEPSQLRKEYGGGGTKSASRKGSRRDNTPSSSTQEGETEDSSNDETDNPAENWYEKNVVVWQEERDRCRPRKRRCSSDWDINNNESTECSDSERKESSPSLPTSLSSVDSVTGLGQGASPSQAEMQKDRR